MNNVEQVIKETIEKIFSIIGVTADVQISKDIENVFVVDLNGEDLGVVIGFHGDGLLSLQTVVSLIVSKKIGEYTPLKIDINDYRKQREQKIYDLIKNTIDRVRFSGKPIELSPMNPAERRLVHTEVSKYSDVVSESVGEGHSRRPVIRLKS